MTNDRVDVKCHFRCVRPKHIAVWDGDRVRDGREEWTWLPRSQVIWRRMRAKNCDVVIVTMPRQVAIERGMRWR